MESFFARYWDNVVAKIFLQPRLDSPAYVARHRVLLSDVGSSSNHPLDPGLHYLLKVLDVDLRVKSEVMW